MHRVAWFLLSVWLALGMPLAALGPRMDTADPGVHVLSYVESSAGLIPPTLEAGRTEVEMGDLNGDGNLDLVSIGDHGSPYVNTDEHGVMVWFGDGAGTWSVYQNGDFGYGGVALGDVNGDGFVDVGYGMHHNYSGNDFGDQLLEVALGDGSGQNWVPWDDGLASSGEDWGMFATDFADVDNDGDLDVGSISFGCCAGVHVYLNQGDGTWVQSFGFLGGNSQMHFAFGDVNGDGNADLAVSHEGGTVYLGDGSGGFSLDDGNLPPPGWIGHSGVALGDVDHDGGADLAFCNSSGGVEVWSWVGPGTWQDLSGSLPSSGPYEAAQLFDMDMDGSLDVAAYGEGQLRVWGGDGAGGWSEIAALSTPAPGYCSAFRVGGDADHNGYPDIVLVAEEGSWPNEQNRARFFLEASTPTALAIRPVFPQGHETFYAGTVLFVDWISAVPLGELGTVGLEFSLHGPSGPWQPLASGLPDGGRYQWRIPPDTPSTGEALIRYTLVVSPEITASVTAAPFSIVGSSEEPIAGLQAANDSPTSLGQVTTLTATVVSGTNVVYNWALGDGAAASGPLIAHIYPAVGTFTAVVTASNSIGQVTATTHVTITEQPIAGLTAVNDGPTVLGQLTTLTATVLSGTGVVYQWALGDGSVDEGRVVTHLYPLGTFTAVVTASNSVSRMTATTTVRVEEAIAGLTAVNDGPTVLGQLTTLTATVLSGTGVVYRWALGDGSADEGAVVPHLYPAGTFTAAVTASNSVSRMTATTTVRVEEAIAGLSAVNDGPTVLGQLTTLTATVLSGTGVLYEWGLGDGAVASGMVLTHLYGLAGTYPAVVTASNPVGSATAQTVVEVVARWRVYLPLVFCRVHEQPGR